MAKEITKVSTSIEAGLKVDVEARGHTFRLDEPKNLGGTDTGMNPVEALLGALGGCKLIVAKSFARMHEMKINSIKIDLEGELDPDGFMGKNPDAKVGFSNIKTIYHIDADNTKEEIDAYVEFIERTCPVLDTIKEAPTFETEIL